MLYQSTFTAEPQCFRSKPDKLLQNHENDTSVSQLACVHSPGIKLHCSAKSNSNNDDNNNK